MIVGLGISLLSAHEPTRPKFAVVLPDQEQSEAKEDSNTCLLTLRLIDAVTGQTRPGCFRLKENDGENFLECSGVLPRTLGLSKKYRQLGWQVSRGEERIAVPRKQLRISAFSGIEYSVETRQIDLRNRKEATIDLPLTRLFAPREQGWIAGNTHLHLRELTRETADRYLTEVSRADGLEIVFVSYLERAIVDRGYTSNAYTAADLERISGKGTWFCLGEEYRHNFGGGGEGYGHVMFLDIPKPILPASLGPGITGMGHDGIPLRGGIDQARKDQATIVWCHNAFGLEDIPSWLSDRVDAQNIFDGGNRGSYRDSFYRYLNLGMRVPFSTGTDWFIYDLSRVYVRLPNDAKMSPQSWLKHLREGRSLITNGPWIELRVDRSQPGDTIRSDSGRSVQVSARSTGRHPIEGIEIVKNGIVVLEGREISKADLQVDQSSWIAARIRPREGIRNEFDRPLFAHTSPIFVEIEGRPVFDKPTADQTLAELRSSIDLIREKGTFEDPAGETKVIELYENAIQFLSDRKDSAK